MIHEDLYAQKKEEKLPHGKRGTAGENGSRRLSEEGGGRRNMGRGRYSS